MIFVDSHGNLFHAGCIPDDLEAYTELDDLGEISPADTCALCRGMILQEPGADIDDGGC